MNICRNCIENKELKKLLTFELNKFQCKVCEGSDLSASLYDIASLIDIKFKKYYKFGELDEE